MRERVTVTLCVSLSVCLPVSLSLLILEKGAVFGVETYISTF